MGQDPFEQNIQKDCEDLKKKCKLASLLSRSETKKLTYIGTEFTF